MNDASFIFLQDVIFILLATVVTVPLFKRLGLGTVLGFLAGGIIIGPWGLKFIEDVDAIMHFAELGVVLLLFIIGLELLPQRLWSMKKQILGFGSGQILLSTLFIYLFCLFLGLESTTSLFVAVGMTLSSTAFALQMLAEKNQLGTAHGQRAFSILILQDIFVIPLLAIVPVMGSIELLTLSDGVVPLAKKMGVVLLLVLVGHFLLKPFFRFVASTNNQEVFTASALLVVLGIAAIMHWVGISMALGAFIAGVLLADSEYRHELEANIEPFKGLLMGLFFISIGMSINIGMFFDSFVGVLAMIMCIVIIKVLVLLLVGRVGGLDQSGSRKLAIMLSQTGEFAFVLFTLGKANNVITDELFQLLMLVVALSMASTPFLFLLNEKYGTKAESIDDLTALTPPEDASHVMIAGFGRFGEIIARVLMSRDIHFTALDTNPKQVQFVKRFGNRIFYGDASRIDVLKAANVSSAKILIIAVDSPKASLKLAKIARKNFPHLKIFARARDRFHAYQLIDAGVDLVNRETFESSLEMAKEVMMELSLPDSVVAETIRIFRYQDQKLLWRKMDGREDVTSIIELAGKIAKKKAKEKV